MKRAALALAAAVAALAVVYFAFPGVTLTAFLAFERGRAGVARKSVHIDGHTIVYVDGGQGEPMLLVHGFGGDKDNWTRYARYLAPRFRAIAIDLPAYGESTYREDASYDIASQVERLDRFATALGLDKFAAGTRRRSSAPRRPRATTSPSSTPRAE